MSILLVKIKAAFKLRHLKFVYNEIEEIQPLIPMHLLNFGKELSFSINFFDVTEDFWVNEETEKIFPSWKVPIVTLKTIVVQMEKAIIVEFENNPFLEESYFTYTAKSGWCCFDWSWYEK